ncbi:hypothetical protein M2317_002548 [Microbacterium sp. ZKA21]|jgi:hypothetical protein|uniref:hypothetical protein n=1 Tax=Microbacterium sp. ZKA21 TaxID=3381694 RepID=UPI003D1F8726
MTAVTLNHAGPTRLETTLLRLAALLNAYVAHRRELRAERRARELAALREAQVRPTDPRELDVALLSMGSRPR